MIQSKIALRPPAQAGFKHAKTTTFLWALLTLALHVCPGIVSPVHAQGTRKDDIVFNSRGIPLAGAAVRVCAMPASGQPCTPLALIYSDAALTQALANPTTTDGLGNYFFYAAPGKYEIEVSGPGISTKQLPNVILPNDPSSPTFSSVSTNAINAFSLTLSGNLTVNGNTTVVGNLASGTLNLANQSTPPGAAGSGTVNLYTKTADKRLYYKDDTGTEIGPIASGSGAQTNVQNTFTAQQNFDANFEAKGPNPYFSLSRYGGYGSGTNPPPTITCSINSASTTLTCPGGSGDFLNGHGVVIPKAGAATTLTTPGQPTVTPTNLLNGTTTYTYQVVAEDRQGGLTTSSTSGQTTTGASTLGANNITFASCVRTNGVATYTSSVAHNLQAGAQVNISGFSGGVFDYCNGVKTIVSATATTFTTNDGSLSNETNTTGSPIVTVMACNTLTYASGSFSGINAIHYWIYRNGALAGVAVGIDPWFQDCGSNVNTAPSYVPTTPPSSAQPGYLASTIVSGAGTTSLTLANAAGTTVSSATVVHDNSPNLKSAIQAAYNAGGGAVYISNGMVYVPFNSTLDLTTGLTNTFSYSVKIHSNDDFVVINQPWILRTAVDIEGEPHQTTSFSYVNGSQFLGNANPMFLIPEVNGVNGVHFNRVLLAIGGTQQTAILTDSGTDGGGTAGLVLDDIDINGNGGLGRPLVFKGGFDYFVNRGNCQNGAGTFTGSSCLQLTNVSPAVTSGGPAQVPGRLKVNGLYFAGGAIDIDCLPNSSGVAPTDFEFDTTIFESAVAPYLRFNCPSGIFNIISLRDVVEADSIVGFGTAVVDAQNGGSINSLLWSGGSVGNAGQPLFLAPSTASSANALILDGPFNNLGNTSFVNVSGQGLVSNGLLSVSGNGRIVYGMPTPAAPGVVVSSGGSVTLGSIPYQIQWVDIDGNYSAVSPSVIAVTSSGNQTVTLTPPAAPGGAVGYVPYRNGAKLNVQGFGTCASILPVTQVFVDTFSFVCGTSTANATAGTSIVGPNGLSGPQLRFTSNGSVASTSFPSGLTANRTFSIPDVTGYLPVTSYLNSAYDNATRANGAIGANWTLTNNGFNITSNNFVGTTGGANNVAFWSASLFSASQFSQVTLTALNGTVDFPGVAVLLSGSGASTQGYNCIETTTNIYMQKIVGTSNTTLTSAASTGAAGDILRLEAAPGGALTCYKNGVSTLTATDTTYSSGQPGLFVNGSTATSKNWSGGNLHPLAQLDVEQDWTKPQHFAQGLALSGETISSSPRGGQNVFLPGALTSTWTGSTWTPDKAVTVTRLQVQTKTAPSGCTTNAVVRLTDGASPVNVTVAAAANDSGAIAQNYAAGASLTVALQTAAAGCTTSPADANVIVQYRMQ
jgi:hypothetical protein